jgi:hypothetical protein
MQRTIFTGDGIELHAYQVFTVCPDTLEAPRNFLAQDVYMGSVCFMRSGRVIVGWHGVCPNRGDYTNELMDYQARIYS